jgi:hypothetical protein
MFIKGGRKSPAFVRVESDCFCATCRSAIRGFASKGAHKTAAFSQLHK